MRKADMQVNFDLGKIVKRLGLEEQGRVQQFATSEVLRLSESYVPFDLAGKYKLPGNLIDSGHIENGNEVVWGGNRAPYARRLYYHPEYNFQGAPIRGGYWVDRMLQNGGRKLIETSARKLVKG